MIRTILKIAAILFIPELLLFAGMIMLAMTDDRPPAILSYFSWMLNHIFGFPLRILNSEDPFFLETGHFALAPLFLAILNNLFLATVFWGLAKFLEKLLNRKD